MNKAPSAYFRNSFAEDIFNQKYRHEGCNTWEDMAQTVTNDVCSLYMNIDDRNQLVQYITDMKFIPGGRYLYYAGRKRRFYNNCFLLKSEEDTREDWAELSKKVELCLSVGGGIGNDYSIYRPRGSHLHGTGGTASGPVDKIKMINEIGRGVIQGGSRRAALYGSLSCDHDDIYEFMHAKNWYEQPVGTSGLTLGQVKEQDFNFPAPLDMTNISINYNTDWLLSYWKTGEVGELFMENCKQALSTAEPGFSFNFFDKENETLRNACTEVTSEDDSDVCNLGSINLANISDMEELKSVVELTTMFLICGSLRAELPYEKVDVVRAKNRRLGLGLMGIHEWLIQREYKYEVPEELHRWLTIYRDVSDYISRTFADSLSISRPIANRAVAPTGSIGILAGTTTGIEPLYAVAYKRRYLKGTRWQHQFVVDSAAQTMIDEYGVAPDSIECAIDLATDYKRRLSVQANVQEYVDHGISSTINMPEWGTEYNNEDGVSEFANTLASYAHRIRGFTVYPNKCRGGQPITAVPYKEALAKTGEVYQETTDVCDITGIGFCGV